MFLVNLQNHQPKHDAGCHVHLHPRLTVRQYGGLRLTFGQDGF